MLLNNKYKSNKDNISTLLRKFFFVIIIIICIAYFTFEYLDIYPFTSYIENFISTKYITEPKPNNISLYPKEGTEVSTIFTNNNDINNNNVNNNIDMNILANQRYYKSLLDTSNNNNNKIPKNNNVSLRQEIPSTYMILILKQVIQNNKLFTINNNRLLEFNIILKNINNIINKSKNNIINKSKNNIIFIDNIYLKEKLDKETYDKLNKLFIILKLYLISLINIELIKSGQSHKAHPFQFLKIINSELLGIELKLLHNVNIINYKYGINLVFNIITYRQFKTHSFNIQSTINCNTNNNIKCNILNLELLGTTIQNNLPISHLGMTKLVNGYIGNSIGSPISNQGITGNMEQKQNIPFEKMKYEWIKSNNLQNNKISTIAGKFNKSTYGLEGNNDISNEQIDKIAQISATKGYNPQLYGNYKCFGVYPDGNVITLNEIEDPITCQSYIPEINNVGVWDSPCSKNEECPYYTETGEGIKYGCNINNGKCDMPTGVVRIGYKQSSKYSDKL